MLMISHHGIRPCRPTNPPHLCRTPCTTHFWQQLQKSAKETVSSRHERPIAGGMPTDTAWWRWTEAADVIAFLKHELTKRELGIPQKFAKLAEEDAITGTLMVQMTEEEVKEVQFVHSSPLSYNDDVIGSNQCQCLKKVELNIKNSSCRLVEFLMFISIY